MHASPTGELYFLHTIPPQRQDAPLAGATIRLPESCSTWRTACGRPTSRSSTTWFHGSQNYSTESIPSPRHQFHQVHIRQDVSSYFLRRILFPPLPQSMLKAAEERTPTQTEGHTKNCQLRIICLC